MANEHAIQATGTFVVSKGFRLLTKLAASQGSLQFTRAAVGTGKPPEGYSPESMIGLNAYKIDAEIADYGVQDDMAYITVQVSSDNVTEGFLVTEVGVFAEDPDEGEILYGYMDISTDPTYIYANGSTNRSKFAEFTLYVLVGSVSNVIAAVTPGSIITRDTFTAANLKAIDTHGILGGEAGAETTGQGLIDALTNKLLTEFVTNTVLMERLGTYVLKSKIVNDFLSTDEETVLSGPMGKLLKEQLNVLNTDLNYKREFPSASWFEDTDYAKIHTDFGAICTYGLLVHSYVVVDILKDASPYTCLLKFKRQVAEHTIAWDIKHNEKAVYIAVNGNVNTNQTLAANSQITMIGTFMITSK